MNTFSAKSDASELAEYKVGDRDSRDWGSYVVTAVGLNTTGEEVCEKNITVKPGQILSLQSHDHRREHWAVTEGVLTVIVDGKRMELQAGQDVNIPKGGIHAMANLSGAPCVVHEIQEGICREADIHRFRDMYDRPVEKSEAANVVGSLAVYEAVLAEIRSAPAAGNTMKIKP